MVLSGSSHCHLKVSLQFCLLGYQELGWKCRIATVVEPEIFVRFLTAIQNWLLAIRLDLYEIRNLILPVPVSVDFGTKCKFVIGQNLCFQQAY